MKNKTQQQASSMNKKIMDKAESNQEKPVCSCEECHCAQMPLIGDMAPSFTAETTKGPIHFPEDFKGKWVILFSHPADFTPVCTTEFIMFATMLQEFREMNTELVGLSVDSLSSHIAWLYSIEQQVQFQGHKNVHIDFPLIADLSTKVARKYGMIHPEANDTKTVRAVFFIDPHSKIRTILYYPAQTGRNFNEIKRILISLQIGDEYGVSTPANWVPGDDVILSTPSTLEGAEAASKRNQDTTAVWFLTLEKLPEEKVTALHETDNKKPRSRSKK